MSSAAVADGAEESSARRVFDNSLDFLLAPGDAHALAHLRIGIAALQLTLTLILSPYLLQLYGQLGFVQWPVGELVVFPWLPSIGRVAAVLVPMGLTPTSLVYALFALYLASLLGLLVGWKTPVMAIADWLIHLTMLNSGSLSTYGVDLFSHISLCYCTWMPVGSCLSIDRWLQRVRRSHQRWPGGVEGSSDPPVHRLRHGRNEQNRGRAVVERRSDLAHGDAVPVRAVRLLLAG